MLRKQYSIDACRTHFLVFVSLVLISPLAAHPTQAQTYTVLHAFDAGTDGAVPGPIIRDAQGNLYGTTRFGGIIDCGEDTCGTIYKIDASGNETVLFRFGGSTNGSNPLSALFRDTAGNLYGTTQGNGFDGGQSVVFKLAPNGNETTLFLAGNVNQGCCLDSPVAVDAQGNIYGMSPFGGVPNCGLNNDGLGCGTLFRLSPTGEFTLLHVFDGKDGMQPEGGVVLDGKGNLYGVAAYGGELSCNYPASGQPSEPGCGTIYKLDSKGKFTLLHSFTGPNDGSYPLGLIIDSAGNLYGIAESGGDVIPKSNYEYGVGTVFKVDTTGAFSLLYTFTPCTQPPCLNGNPRNAVFASHLARDSQGNLYGLEQENDCAGGGCLFRIDPQGNLTVLFDFQGENEGSDGFTPMGIVLGSHDDVFGTMQIGGPPETECADNGFTNGCGTVFHLTAH